MKITTRKIVITGALSAITILLGVTKLGFIPFFLGTSITIMHVPVIVGAVLEGPWVGTGIGLLFGLFSLVWAYIGPNGPGDIYFQNVLISVLPRLFIGIMAYLAYRVIRKQVNIYSSWLLWFVFVIALLAPVLAYGTTLLTGNVANIQQTKILILVMSIILATLSGMGLYFIHQEKTEIAALGASAIAGTFTNTILVLVMFGVVGKMGLVPQISWVGLLVLGITNGIPETIGAVLITVTVLSAWKQLEPNQKGARIFRE